jgi:hypothetical protein
VQMRVRRAVRGVDLDGRQSNTLIGVRESTPWRTGSSIEYSVAVAR